MSNSLTEAFGRRRENSREYLFLNGLTSLPDATAHTLAKHQGRLILKGILSC